MAECVKQAGEQKPVGIVKEDQKIVLFEIFDTVGLTLLAHHCGLDTVNSPLWARNC